MTNCINSISCNFVCILILSLKSLLCQFKIKIQFNSKQHKLYAQYLISNKQFNNLLNFILNFSNSSIPQINLFKKDALILKRKKILN